VAMDPCKSDPCASAAASSCCGSSAPTSGADDCPLTYFDGMIGHCLDFAREAEKQGRPVVGICCEYTPRELILAAGGVPVCLCGGSAETIPAAEEDLPANLCPLIKSTYGYHLLQTNPFLEMADLIVAETTCDGKKKMYELMAERRPMYVLELPQKPDDPDAATHWRAELDKLRAELERRFDVKITDAKLRDAIGVMNREREYRRGLAALMQADEPPLTGLELLSLKSSISGRCEDFAQYERALSVLPGREIDSAGRRVRVLMTGVPMAHGSERVLRIIEDSGGLVVCMENCSGLKPILEDVDADAADPMDALAAKYLHLPCSVMTANDRRLDTLRELAEVYRPQCVVDLIWQACLTYDVESARVRRLVEDELHLPYLRIDRQGGFRRTMKTVAYSCPFIPGEWIAAHGLRPRRIVPDAPSGRDRPVEACPYAAAVLEALAAPGSADGVVMTTVCDQMRRAAERLAETADRPTFLLHVPATWRQPAAKALYVDELRRLGRFLVSVGGAAPSDEALASKIREADGRRAELLAARQRLTGRQLAEAIASIAGGDDWARQDSAPRGGCRIALAGGPLTRHDWQLLDALERLGGHIVLDATETGEISLPPRAEEQLLSRDPLSALAGQYFGAIPHAFRRPNTLLYEWLSRELSTREVEGVVFVRHLWCDTWHAEFRRMADTFGLPALDLDLGDPASEARARLEGRIEAFVETLS